MAALQLSQMAEIDVPLKHWTLIVFLFADSEKPTCIHECLHKMYGEAEQLWTWVLLSSGFVTD